MFFLNSPLEQFEVVSLLPFFFFKLDLSFTNASLIIFFSFFFFVFFIQTLAIRGGFLFSSRWQIIVESFYVFTSGLLLENLGQKGQQFYPFVFTLFVVLLLWNIIGIVPYSYTVTSQLIITFMLSSLVWFGKLFLGFRIHGVKLFGILLPSGLPFGIVPFFVLVELISFIIPLGALGIRLFANIMAGHILLKVLVGFCWSMLLAYGVFFFLHFIPMVVVFLLLFLETAVAFIQAYVFTMLSCLYIGDILRGGH